MTHEEFLSWSRLRHEQVGSPLSGIDLEDDGLDWNWVFGSYSFMDPAATAFASPDLLATQICRHVDHKIVEIIGFRILRTDIGTGWILKDNYHEDTAYVYHNAFQISVMVAPLFQQAGFDKFHFVCLFVCCLMIYS